VKPLGGDVLSLGRACSLVRGLAVGAAADRRSALLDLSLSLSLVCIDREMRKWRLGFDGRTRSGVFDPAKVTHSRRIRIDGRCGFGLALGPGR
jgi:hypothetical protein